MLVLGLAHSRNVGRVCANECLRECHVSGDVDIDIDAAVDISSCSSC